MPRLHGVKERRHQPFWDSLLRTTGDPTPAVAVRTTLFGNANVGQFALSNLQVPGQFASDQTYAILAMRCWLYFRGTNHRANYLLTSTQLYFTLQLGDKPQFAAPAWYFPAGGGKLMPRIASQEVYVNLAISQKLWTKFRYCATVKIRNGQTTSWEDLERKGQIYEGFDPVKKET